MILKVVLVLSQRTSLYAHPYDCCRVAAFAPALRHMCARCRHTRGRFERTHGGVSESTIGFFPRFFQRAATHTPHTKHTHTKHTPRPHHHDHDHHNDHDDDHHHHGSFSRCECACCLFVTWQPSSVDRVSSELQHVVRLRCTCGRHESTRDRRAKRQRVECRPRLRLVRDAACVAAHRGGSSVCERPVDSVREALDGLRCDLSRLQEDFLVLRSEICDVNHNATALTKFVVTLAHVVGVRPSSEYVDQCWPDVDLLRWEECAEHLSDRVLNSWNARFGEAFHDFCGVVEGHRSGLDSCSTPLSWVCTHGVFLRTRVAVISQVLSLHSRTIATGLTNGACNFLSPSLCPNRLRLLMQRCSARAR